MYKRLLILFVTLLFSTCLLAVRGEDQKASLNSEATKDTASQTATTAATTATEANTKQKPTQAETTANNNKTDKDE